MSKTRLSGTGFKYKSQAVGNVYQLNSYSLRDDPWITQGLYGWRRSSMVIRVS